MSGALGQGRNGTLDNWLYGCGQHFSATQGTQPRAKPEFLEKNKKWNWELKLCIRETNISLYLKQNLLNSHISLEAFMQGSNFMPAKKKTSINKNRNSWQRSVKPSMKAKKGLVVIPWINGFDKGMCK